MLNALERNTVSFVQRVYFKLATRKVPELQNDAFLRCKRRRKSQFLLMG